MRDNVLCEFPAGYDGAAILERLAQVLDPELDESILDLGFVRSLQLRSGHVRVAVQLPTSWCAVNFAYLMAEDIRRALLTVDGIRQATVSLRDHCAAEEIEAAVNDGRPFANAFPGEGAGSLTSNRRSGLSENALDHVDGNPVDPGDLGNRHPVLHPGSDAKIMTSDLRRDLGGVVNRAHKRAYLRAASAHAPARSCSRPASPRSPGVSLTRQFDSPPVAPSSFKAKTAIPCSMTKVLSLVALTKIDVYCLSMIKFLDVPSAFEHYKRVLGGKGPIETRARYDGDCLYVEHYHAHTGQFIIGGIFKKGGRRDPGAFLGLFSEPPSHRRI